MNDSQAYRLAQLIVLGMFVQLLVIGYVFYSQYEGRLVTYENLQAGCERSKKDRVANADFQNAHRDYIKRVVLAQSVKEDVKRAARDALATYQVTADALLERSSIDCHKAFAKPGILP